MDWRKEIGRFARERSAEASGVDKDLKDLATSGYYSYGQSGENPNPLRTDKSAIYQSYDQQHGEEETTPAMAEEEGHPSYWTQSKDSVEVDEVVSLGDEGKDNSKNPDEPADDDKPLSKKVVFELIVCILAFVGRGLCLNSVGPTLIDLRQIAGISVAQSACIFISQSTGFFIGSISAKGLLQRFNNELLLGLCLLLQAACTALIPAFRSVVSMCLMFVGQGVAIGVVGIGVCSTCIRIGGAKRNGMFLQAVYLGVSVGSVLGPLIARPFLSSLARTTDNHYYNSTERVDELTGEYGPVIEDDTLHLALERRNETFYGVTPDNITSAFNRSIHDDDVDELSQYTMTHVQFYYVFIGLILCIPALFFVVLYTKTRNERKSSGQAGKKSEPLTLALLTKPLAVAIVLLFVQCLLYFGVQDTYSNLLTTFAVLGPLHMAKTKGVYVTSLFWASMCFGRLNGIWVAKFVSPFKMLLIDLGVAAAAASGLIVFGGRYEVALWLFTLILGLSFASVNGATVSWAAAHMPENNYILSVIMIGRCTGLLILPSTVTTMFKVIGAMSLMATVFVTVILMLIGILVMQGLTQRFGVKGRLHGKAYLDEGDDNQP